MKRVLLVESDILMLKSWELSLQKSEWEFYFLDSWDDFDFRFKEFSPDIVVASCNMLEQRQPLIDTPLISLGKSSFPVAGVLSLPLRVQRLPSLLEELLEGL